MSLVDLHGGHRISLSLCRHDFAEVAGQEFLRGNALEVVQRVISSVAVFDLFTTCVLLAEAVHGALLVLGFKHFLVAS